MLEMIMTFAPYSKALGFQATMSTLLLLSLLMQTGCGEKAPTAKSQAALPAMSAKEPTLEEKVAKWQKEAAAGNAEAQYQLGCVSYLGEALSKEAEKSILWSDYKPKDPAKALEWMQKAATQGHAGAQYVMWAVLGKGIPDDKRFELLTKAAEGGSPLAQATLGMFFLYGSGGVPKDVVKAVAWLQKSADQGCPVGQDVLGFRFEIGDGVLKNAEKAVELYQKAAINGHADAQHSLAMKYESGEGIVKDLVLAYAWSNVAAATAGSNSFVRKRAVNTRDGLEAHLFPEQVTEGQRIAARWKKGEFLKRETGGEVGVGGPALVGASIKSGMGTVFVLSKDGHALTSHHVIDGCKEVKVAGREGVVKVIASDIANDISLLQLPGENKDVAAITADTTKLRQGEDVLVFGYPLSITLSSGGNLTLGTVSALSGLGNNSNQIQVSAPIQPGSSGSPVLDRKGNVVGVVSMKLSDAKMASSTGSLPQNVNFAVGGQTVKAFLDQNKVIYSTGGGFFSRKKSNADIAEAARKYTFIVECWK